MLEKLSRTELVYSGLATLFAGMAYIFVDVATNGIIRVQPITAYVIVLLTVMSLGYLRSR